MVVCVGEMVLVNAAAFIGSQRRNRESIPCEILGVDGARVLVKTRLPYRVFTMCISQDWIEDPDSASAHP